MYHQGKELGGGVGVELLDYNPENLCVTEHCIHVHAGSNTSCSSKKQKLAPPPTYLREEHRLDSREWWESS